jgi:hypothetical protein
MKDLGRIKGNVAKMVSMGAPEEDIDAYISGEGTTIDQVRAFKPEQQGGGSFLEENVERPLARTAKSGLAGAAEALEAPQNIGGAVQSLIGKAVDPFLPQQFVDTVAAKKQALAQQYPDVSQQIRQGFDSATNGMTVPRNDLEKGVDTAVEFAGGLGGPELLAKGAAAIPKAAEAMGAIPNAVQSGLAKLTGVNPGKVAEFEAANIPPTLGAVSDSPNVKRVENTLSAVPLGGGPLRKTYEKTMQETSKVLDDLGLKAGTTPQQAGSMAQGRLEQFGEQVNAAWKKNDEELQKFIKPTEKFPLDNLQALKADMEQKALGNAAKLEEIKNSAPYKQIERIESLADNGNLEFGLMRNERTFIRSKSRDSMLPGGNSADNAGLQRIEGAITGDLKNAVAQKGELASSLFNKNNELYAKYIDESNSELKKFLTKKEPERIYAALKEGTKLGGTNADALMGKLSASERQTMRGSLLKDFGTDPKTQEFNAIRSLRQFDKLAPEAKSAFMRGTTSSTRQQFENLVKVSRDLAELEKFGNPSGSGYAANIGGLVGVSAINPKAAIATPLLANAGSRLMANKGFIKWLSEGAKLKDEQALAKHLADLPRVARANPEIAPDVHDYVKKVGRGLGLAAVSQPQDTKGGNAQ